jgi:V/A-type H+-transporting ATPase subunit F
MNEEYRIAIVGPEKMTSGFKALGVDVFDAETGEQAVNKIKELRGTAETKTKYAVILLLEELAKHIPEDEYARLSQGPLPALLVLPGVSGSTGRGAQHLKHLAERAVGSDIL